MRLLLCSISALRWELPVLPNGGVWFPAVGCHAPEGRRLAAKMLEVSSDNLVELLSFRLCFFSYSDRTRGGAMCSRCVSEDPGSAKSNSMLVRVLFVILHIWRMCPEVLAVISTFSRVLSVKAWFSLWMALAPRRSSLLARAMLSRSGRGLPQSPQKCAALCGLPQVPA